jgi:RNA polymerase sigma factor (sigma-70 family)
MPGAETLSEIYLAWRNRLARIVSRLVPPHDVEDVVQETYVRACEFSAKSEIKSAGTFMTSIARNLALDYVKRAEWRLTSPVGEDVEALFGEAPEASSEPFRQVASSEEFGHFCEAVRQLPLPCRKVFVLKKVYGHSQRDIAEALSLSENIVEKLIAQGVKQCVLYMRQREEAHSPPAVAGYSRSSQMRKGQSKRGGRR